LASKSTMLESLTYNDVAIHRNPNDYYIVIHAKVYNISSFIDDHPGGEEVLKDVAGGDATEAFEDVGHSPEALNILATLRIGDLKKQAGNSAAPTEKLSQALPVTTAESSSFALYAIILCLALGAYLAYKVL